MIRTGGLKLFQGERLGINAEIVRVLEKIEL